LGEMTYAPVAPGKNIKSVAEKISIAHPPVAYSVIKCL